MSESSRRRAHGAAELLGRPHVCSRRHAIGFGAAASALAAGLAAGLPSVAAASTGTPRANGRRQGIPSPVGGSSPLMEGVFGVPVPFFLPVEVDPFTGFPAGPPRDPSTIGDFNGVVALVEADGIATDSDGQVRRWASDIRAIEGVYRTRDGRTAVGAFAFL